MENVTKALLIAASVLVAILIISLSIMIVNRNDASEDAKEALNGMNIQTFNSKYEVHEGICSGSTVRTILSYVVNDNTELFNGAEKDAAYIEYNLNVRSNDPDILDYFRGSSSMIEALDGSRSYGVRYPENILQVQQAVKSYKKYNVWYSYNKQTGYIWEVHIDAR